MNLGLLDPKNEAPIDMVCPVNWLHPLNRGLVGWWLCLPGLMGGGKWLDLCRKNDGTLTNMDPVTDWVGASGRPGGWGALDFDGTDDLIAVPHHLDFDLSATDYSYSFWVNAAAAASQDSFVAFLSKGDATTSEWAFQRNSGGNHLFIYHGATSLQFTNFLSNVFGAGWVHLAITYRNIDKNVRLFLNGNLSSSASHAANPTSSTKQVNIASSRDPIELEGKMDDVMIWRRQLTDLEIQSVYNLSRQSYPGLLRRVRRYVWPEETAAVGRIFKIAGSGGSLAGVSRGLVA